jgi:hypothetical protein
MDVKSPPLHNNITLKGEEECECYSLLNVTTRNAEHVAFFHSRILVLRSKSRTTRGTVTSYTALAHLCGIHVYCTEHSYPFQMEIWQKCFCSNALYDLNSLPRDSQSEEKVNFVFLLNFCKIPAVR